MKMIFRALAWLFIIAILVLSFVPASDRPTTGTSSNLEHLAIYVATGFAFAGGYAERLLVVTGGLVLFSGILEVMQNLAPTRHARLSDFLIDAGASMLGIVLFVVAKRILSLWRT